MQSTTYEYVIAVAKHRSISKAAQALCITQPALTKYINRLEDHIGIRLFDRTVSPIAITPAGEKFVEKAAMILEIERGLQYDLSRVSGSQMGEINVGMNTEFCGNTIPYVLPEFRFRYPEVKVNLCEGHNEYLFEELEAGRLDMAYAAYGPQAKYFIYESIYDEAILLAVPMGHPLAAQMDLSNNSPLTPFYLKPERVRGCDFVVLIPQQGMGAFARNMFYKYNLDPQIVLEMRKHETALRLASAGLGMIFTPIRTPLRIQLVKPMAYFSIENPVSCRSRGVYYSKNVPLTDAARCFMQVFNDVLKYEKAIQNPACQLLFPPAAPS